MALELRRLTRSDFPQMSRWLAAPHVQQWWREPTDLASIDENYGPSVDGTDPTEHFVVTLDGQDIGMIQRYLIDDSPEYRSALEPAGVAPGAASLDYFIGDPSRVGQGWGPVLIAQTARTVWTRYPQSPAIVVALQQDNRRSWRALEKAGFRRTWAGQVDTGDPSDEGPSFVYVLNRPAATDSTDPVA